MNKKAQKQDRFLRGRQIAYLIYEYFPVTGANDFVENYAPTCSLSALRNDDIQEFDSKWDGISLSMTTIPLDDILEGLYKLRIRESEKTQDRIGIVWPGDSSEEIRTMIVTDWKRWWKEISSKTCEIRMLGARNGNYERNAVVQNQGTKTVRTKELLGYCWEWKAQRAVF